MYLPTECPACYYQNNRPMGNLGNLVWYRCRSCGIDYHAQFPAPPSRKETTLNVDPQYHPPMCECVACVDQFALADL